MTGPLRVAYDMTFPNRNQAGSGVYARELLTQLECRDDLTISTIAAAGRGGLPTTLAWLTSGARRAAAGSQVVHCPAFVAPWRVSSRLVLTVHDTTTHKFPEDHTLEWRAYTNLFLPERARSAARVITGTESTRRDIVNDLGVPEERVTVTPYGISPRFALPTRPLRPVGDPAYLLFPGAPSKRKNLELVISAMAKAPAGSKLKRARLAISGASPDRFPHHRALIESMGLGERVDWRGQVPAESMPALMSECDVLVYPSLYEGFGFPPLEAMLAGTPVVASNAASLPELLGDSALLVDPSDTAGFIGAVEAVLNQDHLRSELVAKGRARAARYSWSRCADLTVEVYRQAMRT
jgi:glycosyltransferase involved in cell wall biosynthesis